MSYSKFTPINFGVIKSEFQKLTEEFIKGVHLTIDLSSYIYKVLDRSNTNTYIDDVTYIKKVLDTSKKVFTKDVFYMKTNYNLSDNQKQLIVRFINLCHAEKDKLIVINDVIVYRSENFHGYDDVAILMYITNTINLNNKLRKQDLIKVKKQRKQERLFTFAY